MTAHDGVAGADRGRSRFVELAAGRFHYRTWAPERSDGSCAVLLHGSADSSAGWCRVAPALAADGAVVHALDLRGHGASAKPPDGPYDLPTVAEDVAEFIAALRLERPVLVGHCWGAAVALVLAAGAGLKTPAPSLSGLVLEDLPGDLSFSGNEVFRSAFDRAVRMSRQELEEVVDAFHPHWHPLDRASSLDGMTGTDPRIAAHVAADGAAFGALPPLLARVRSPVLLLRADPRCGGVMDDPTWEIARRLLPAASEAHHLPGVPHDVHRSDLPGFTDLLGRFRRSATP